MVVDLSENMGLSPVQSDGHNNGLGGMSQSLPPVSCRLAAAHSGLCSGQFVFFGQRNLKSKNAFFSNMNNVLLPCVILTEDLKVICKTHHKPTPTINNYMLQLWVLACQVSQTDPWFT